MFTLVIYPPTFPVQHHLFFVSLSYVMIRTYLLDYTRTTPTLLYLYPTVFRQVSTSPHYSTHLSSLITVRIFLPKLCCFFLYPYSSTLLTFLHVFFPCNHFSALYCSTRLPREITPTLFFHVTSHR